MPLFSFPNIDTASHSFNLDTGMHLHVRRRLGAIRVTGLEDMHGRQDSGGEEEEPKMQT